jgi:hypothetical protein
MIILKESTAKLCFDNREISKLNIEILNCHFCLEHNRGAIDF